MFGVGGQEVVLIALLVLVIFGPSKLVAIARELGRFGYEARSSLDELNSKFEEPLPRELNRELEESDKPPGKKIDIEG